jgi:16S rRNA (cytosine967-C5)-methyltransferase
VLHFPLVRELVLALDQIFRGAQHADAVIHRTLKRKKIWGSRDRQFFAAAAFEVVRHWRRYLFVADHRPGESLTEEVFYRVIGAYLIESGSDLPGWTAFAGLDAGWLRDRLQAARAEIFPVRESYPDWLWERLRRERNDAEELLVSLNRPAPVFVRANTLKTTPQKLFDTLKSEGVAVQSVHGDCLRLAERKNLLGHKSFQSGMFEIQDMASQQVATFLQVEPGHRVIDACAGAGGKTLHIAMLMKNKGRLLAMDINQAKLAQLRIRARRAGVQNFETQWIDSTKITKRQENSADRLLLDVPCSGLGVMRRHPDTKWKLTAEQLKELQALQARIMADYCRMVRVGGLMVYATCSVLPSENERQTEAFLRQAEGRFRLVAESRIDPHVSDSDGFYMARFERVADEGPESSARDRDAAVGRIP